MEDQVDNRIVLTYCASPGRKEPWSERPCKWMREHGECPDPTCLGNAEPSTKEPKEVE